MCEGELSTLAPALCVGAGPISGPQLPLGRRGRHQRHHVRRVRERAPSDGGPGQRDLCYDGRGRCRPHSGKRRRPHCGPNKITFGCVDQNCGHIVAPIEPHQPTNVPFLLTILLHWPILMCPIEPHQPTNVPFLLTILLHWPILMCPMGHN